MSTGTARQVAGHHYLNMGIQPIEFAMANGWDAGAFSILKYLSRHRQKNGLQDVQKGAHFVELRDQFLEHVVVPDQRVTMEEYLGRNGIVGATKIALALLERWVLAPGSDTARRSLLYAIGEIEREYETGQGHLDLTTSPLS